METTEDKKEKKGMASRLLGYAVRWLLPLALTILLVSYMFRKVNFADMWEIMRHGVDYGWILCAMAISVFSHIFRAIRWRIQLRSLGIGTPLGALCCSIFGCYALNLIFPRLGEVWRCTYVSRREHAAFTTVFGSMVADRLSDTLCVLVLTVLAFIVAAPAINAFLTKYPVGQGLIATASSPWFWIAVVGGCLLIWAIFHFGGSCRPVKKIRDWGADTWKGFAVVTKMKGKWQFLLLTIAIWACYYVQLYVAFFAFPFTRELCAADGTAFGLIPCLVAFVLSSIGMAVPSNGGLGPWNIAVMFGLAIYGMSAPDGTAFSMLQWSGQTVMLILLGIYTMVYISIDGRRHSAAKAMRSGGEEKSKQESLER